MIECMPNISEGRRTDVVAGWRTRSARIAGCGCSTSRPNPRTIARSSRSLGDATASSGPCSRCSRAPSRTIDLRTQRGEHPRLGAVDVVPFVPIDGATMAECVALRSKVGAPSRRFGVPVTYTRTPQPTRRAKTSRTSGAANSRGSRPRWPSPAGRPNSAPRRLIRPPARPSSAPAIRSSPTTSISRPIDSTSRSRSPPRSSKRRRAAVRQGARDRAGGSRHRAGVDEPHELSRRPDRRVFDAVNARRRGSA